MRVSFVGCFHAGQRAVEVEQHAIARGVAECCVEAFKALYVEVHDGVSAIAGVRHLSAHLGAEAGETPAFGQRIGEREVLHSPRRAKLHMADVQGNAEHGAEQCDDAGHELHRILAQEVERADGMYGEAALRKPGGHLAFGGVLHAAVEDAHQSSVGVAAHADAHAVEEGGDGGDAQALVLGFRQQVVRHVGIGKGDIGFAFKHCIEAIFRGVAVHDVVFGVRRVRRARGEREAAWQRDARTGRIRSCDKGHGVAQIGAGDVEAFDRLGVGFSIDVVHDVGVAAFDEADGLVVAVRSHEFELQPGDLRDVFEQQCDRAGERAGFGVGVGKRRAIRIVGHAQGGSRRQIGVLVFGEDGILVGVDAEVAVVQQRGEVGVAQFEAAHRAVELIGYVGAFGREGDVQRLGGELSYGSEARIRPEICDGNGIHRSFVERFQQISGSAVGHDIRRKAVLLAVLRERFGVLAVRDHAHAHAGKRFEVLVGVTRVVEPHVERGGNLAER